MNYFICHYSEIGLKRKNRAFFEKKLIFNIKEIIGRENINRIYKNISTIIIETEKSGSFMSEKLKKVYGLANFAPSLKTEIDINKIKDVSLQVIKDKKLKTFKVETIKSYKNINLSSHDINCIVGDYILKNTKNKKVNLDSPDITIFIEILKGEVFIYTQKIKCYGGLPVSTAGKVAVMISGGIDSPVASSLMQKRGAKCIFVHFHAYPYTSKSSIEKVERLVKILTEYQIDSKLYLVPFGDIQKEIILTVPTKFRVLFYRRVMVKITQEIAKEENCFGIVTGDSLGQVASQTLESMFCVQHGIKLPIFRPLIGFNKEETIKLSKELNLYEISILPYEDCCSRFVPQNPATKPDIKEFLECEKRLNISKIIKDALKKVEIRNFNLNK
ncbi:putative tRNA sulfurtransferase [bacterium HR34]|nr:putative tRNA sulfurtransferase [bacterium HR34]